MNRIRMGYAVCGSFCTFSKTLEVMKSLSKNYEIFPILSEYSANTDTRFFNHNDFVRECEKISGRKVISTIAQAEPIGPKKMFDILLVAPCTGNTLGKLSSGITDTSVTMSVKAHLRNNRPVLLGVSTNDALGSSAKNIGSLLGRNNIFFIPMKQDDPINKPRSIVCDFSKTEEAAQKALKKEQIQPIYI